MIYKDLKTNRQSVSLSIRRLDGVITAAHHRIIAFTSECVLKLKLFFCFFETEMHICNIKLKTKDRHASHIVVVLKRHET